MRCGEVERLWKNFAEGDLLIVERLTAWVAGRHQIKAWVERLVTADDSRERSGLDVAPDDARVFEVG
jgi:hypothetical protein